jgi:hypothetical protein
VPEELVGGRDDVLDLRTRLRLKQRQRVDENRRIRDQLGSLLELGQGRPRGDALFQDRPRLNVVGRGQQGNRVEWAVGAPPRFRRRRVIFTADL